MFTDAIGWFDGGGGGGYDASAVQGGWGGGVSYEDTVIAPSFSDVGSSGGGFGGIVGQIGGIVSDFVPGGDLIGGFVGLIPGLGGNRPPDAKEQLTSIANGAEQQMRGNLAQWQAGQLSRDAAIAQAWKILNDTVSRMMQYGAQGRVSAAERDRRIDPSMLKWDWAAYYIDPIAGGIAAPAPLPPALGTGAVTSTGQYAGLYTSPGISWGWYAAGAAVLLLVVWKVSKK